MEIDGFTVQAPNYFISLLLHIPGPHMLRHEGVRNFCCNLCDYKAFTKGDMKVHVATVHYQVRKFFCEICGMGFKRTGTLLRHQEGKEKTNLLSRIKCMYSCCL